MPPIPFDFSNFTGANIPGLKLDDDPDFQATLQQAKSNLEADLHDAREDASLFL